MPAEIITEANPPPIPSHLPDRVLELAFKAKREDLDADTIQSLKSFQKAACYIAGCKLTEPAILASNVQH